MNTFAAAVIAITDFITVCNEFLDFLYRKTVWAAEFIHVILNEEEFLQDFGFATYSFHDHGPFRIENQTHDISEYFLKKLPVNIHFLDNYSQINRFGV
jgi:hypothetical protein